MVKESKFKIIYKSFEKFKKKLPLHEPLINKSDENILNHYLRKKMVSTASSTLISKFEKKLSKFTKSKYVVSTNTGTAAMQIALKSIDLKVGQEVLIPAINYIAAANSVLYCGAIPHFVDVDTKTLGVDDYKLKKYLDKYTYIKKNKLINKKTKRTIVALVPTHVFGNACRIDNLKKIAKKKKIYLIEDASEALGSFYKKKQLGTFGDIGIISFNGNKVITTGGGGAILTNNKNLFKKSLHLSKIARVKKKYWEFNYDMLGYNFRMPGLNAALGISQINKLSKILKIKKRIHLIYKNYFSHQRNLRLIEPVNEKPNFWLNSILIKDCKKNELQKIILGLEKKNIFTRPIWKSMNEIRYLSRYPKMNLENTNKIKNKILCLPSGVDILK